MTFFGVSFVFISISFMILDRTLAPDFQAIQSVNIPQVQHYTLDNGLSLHVVNVGEQPIIRLELIFEAGTWYEPSNGVSFFTMKMLSEGTTHYTSAQISEFFDQFGAFTEFGQGMDRAAFTLFGLTKHLSALLPMVRELLEEAIFPTKELADLQRITAQNLRVNLEKTAHVATQTFRKQVFGSGHPYGKNLTFDAIEAINSDDLKAFYEQFIKNRPFSIFMSGMIGEQEIALINKCLGCLAIRSATPVAKETDIRSAPEQIMVEKPESVQSSIRMGKQLMTRQHPDFYKMVMLNEVLGGYFGSRLMRNIREDKGFTYGISSQVAPLSRAGYWVIGTDVKKEHTNQTIDEIRKEIKQLQTELVPADELETVKNFLSGEFAGSLNTAFEITDRYKIIILDKLPANFYEQFIPTIRKVTSEEILQMANTYLSLDSLHEVVVGGR